MERIFNTKATTKLIPQELSRQIAIHAAGHATAIHIGNRRKCLPPVYFQILITPSNSCYPLSKPLPAYPSQCIVNVEGGRLIHTLPSSFAEATKSLSAKQLWAYQQAYEADIVNLLVGPLAEANYIAHRDNEPINPQLVDLNALYYYGGKTDLNVVQEYLACFTDNPESKAQKTQELFLEAFNFVREKRNWRTINALADSILAANTHTIGCNEIIVVNENNLKFEHEPNQRLLA